MELGNFIHEEQAVFDTDIQIGQWYVTTAYQGPAIPFKAVNVHRFGGHVEAVFPDLAQGQGFPPARGAHAFRLDTDYTEEQLLCLQDRALKEYEAWLIQQRNAELHETLKNSLADFD